MFGGEGTGAHFLAVPEVSFSPTFVPVAKWEAVWLYRPEGKGGIDWNTPLFQSCSCVFTYFLPPTFCPCCVLPLHPSLPACKKFLQVVQKEPHVCLKGKPVVSVKNLV